MASYGPALSLAHSLSPDALSRLSRLSTARAMCVCVPTDPRQVCVEEESRVRIARCMEEERGVMGSRETKHMRPADGSRRSAGRAAAGRACAQSAWSPSPARPPRRRGR